MRVLLTALLLLCVLLGLLEVAPYSKSLISSAWAAYLAVLAAWYCLSHELPLGVDGLTSGEWAARGAIRTSFCARCRPLLTKCCTSVVGFAIGDILAQLLAGLRCALRVSSPLVAADCSVACSNIHQMHYMTTDSPTRGIEGSVGYSRKQCLRDMPALRWDAARNSALHDVWVDLPCSRMPLVLWPDRQVSVSRAPISISDCTHATPQQKQRLRLFCGLFVTDICGGTKTGLIWICRYVMPDDPTSVRAIVIKILLDRVLFTPNQHGSALPVQRVHGETIPAQDLCDSLSEVSCITCLMASGTPDRWPLGLRACTLMLHNPTS